MPWGDPAVTRLRRQADRSITYATGVNNPITLEHVGLLKRLRLIFRATATVAAGDSRDAQGPWNVFSNILIRVSGLDLLYQVSGWGLYLINLVNQKLYAPDVNDIVVSNAATTAELFNFPAPGAVAEALVFSLDLPFTLPLLGFEDLGLWLIQNETVNMEVVATFAGATGASKLLQPYVGGGATTITAGHADIWRDFFGVPQNPADMPPLGYVHQWEEQFDSITGSQVDIAHQRGGILTRLIYQVCDAAAGATLPVGLANADLTGLEFKFDANDTPFDEDVFAVLARQRELYGHDLPQGVFTHDFFLDTQDLRNTYNTENYINLKTRFRFGKSLAAGSFIRTIRERLLPVVVNTAG